MDDIFSSLLGSNIDELLIRSGFDSKKLFDEWVRLTEGKFGVGHKPKQVQMFLMTEKATRKT
jgi:hypothetical protein